MKKQGGSESVTMAYRNRLSPFLTNHRFPIPSPHDDLGNVLFRPYCPSNLFIVSNDSEHSRHRISLEQSLDCGGRPEAQSTRHRFSHDPPDPGTSTMRNLKRMDNPTWATMVDRYFDHVYRWCRDGGLDEHTAADVAQEVFVSALGSLHRFQRESRASFGGWLRRICQRRIVDYFRRSPDPAVGGTDALEMFSQLTSIRESLSSGFSENACPKSLDNERLLKAVTVVQTEFESETWQAFWMVTFEDRSASDVAEDLAMTRNAVYLSKSRVLKRLRKELEST